MIPCKHTDHQERAVDTLTDAFRRAPINQALARALARPCNLAEETAWAVAHAHLIGEVYAKVPVRYAACGVLPDLTSAEDVLVNLDAVGAALDDVGAIVNVAREGRTDAAYAAAIRLRIRVNRSKGRPKDVLEVARLAAGLAGTVAYDEPGEPATFVVRVYSIGGDLDATAAAIQSAKAAGTRALLEYADLSDTLIWAYTSETNGHAWAYTNEDTHNVWAGVIA